MSSTIAGLSFGLAPLVLAVAQTAGEDAGASALGTMELFLVPLGPDPDGGRMLFEAVFT